MRDAFYAFVAWLVSRDIGVGDLVLNTLLLVVGIIILKGLWKIHNSNGNYTNFNFIHLIVNKDGYPDGAKCAEWLGIALLSWGFVVYTTSKTLPEWYVWAFLALILRGAYGAHLRSKGEPDTMGIKTEETVTTKTTSVTPPINQDPPNIQAKDVKVEAQGDVTVEKK